MKFITFLRSYYQPIDVVVLSFLMGLCYITGGWLGILQGIAWYLIGTGIGCIYLWLSKR